MNRSRAPSLRCLPLGLLAAPLFAVAALAQTAPPAMPQQAPQTMPAPVQPQTPMSAAEAMANEAFDGFRVHCLANLANPKLVKDGAKKMKYAPVEPDVIKRLGTDDAWYVPSDHGSIILGLSAKGNCGVVVQTVDAPAFATLLETKLPLNLASDEVKSGLRTRVYSLLYDNRTATLRLRHGADSSRLAPVSVSVSDSKPVPLPQVATPPKPTPPPRDLTKEAQQQTAEAPALSSPMRPDQRRPVQVAFPAKPALDAWDPNKKALENSLTLSFSDACYNTRSQPADVLARAKQANWRPLKAADLGAGFDFAWTTPEAPPEQLLVFYDSLKPRCCVGAFGVHKLDMLTAAMKRFALTPEKAFAVGPKEVIQFTPRKDYQLSLDFEPADDGTTFANLCYVGRR